MICLSGPRTSLSVPRRVLHFYLIISGNNFNKTLKELTSAVSNNFKLKTCHIYKINYLVQKCIDMQTLYNSNIIMTSMIMKN